VNDLELLEKSTEVEKALVGAMLLESGCISQAAAAIVPSEISDPLAKKAFTMMVNTHAAGDVVHIDVMARGKEPKDAEFRGFLGECAIAAVAYAIETYIREVKQFAILRALRSLNVAFGERLNGAHRNPNDAMDYVSWLRSRIDQITASQNDTEIQTIGSFARLAIERIDHSIHTRSQQGLPTGLETMDETLGGLFPGELTTIAARPGVGKTSLGIQIARYIASNVGRAVVFSLEMTGEELAQRSLCTLAEVCSQRVRSGAINNDEYNRLIKHVPDLDACELFVDDRSSRDIGQIAAACRLLATESSISIVVVDYVGLVKPTSLSKGRSRAEQISEVMKGLKAIAKDLSCPVLALSQVNREAAKEGWLRLHHLKDSGSIEEDSNSVWFIQSDGDKVQIEVAKNRNGQIGVNEIDWNPRLTVFKDVESRGLPNYEHGFSEYAT
jgi:replicative DNA helicase